ncbi:hypothetical protein SHELI_v1c03180 [Spiroplasma helicoides]|uniref:Uncharacterized protein n=1 Tax=Spiroplasma helicoides TaxID=216938 RepID=A0A1B3SK13_9MOLU|nr:hypothetical protein [Spiroplasma helicoides]AOG60273.1 hypothetical protein SHELI_v1c03180 [Spiroplasma helicoides]
MAAEKKSSGKSRSNEKQDANSGTQYVWQNFGTKSLALINKYSLQTDDNYKKLISSYERIDSLPEDDPRRPNLIELWETEFNRLFKHFWENYTLGTKKSESGISGWKDRLDIKQVANTPDAKRKDLLSRLSVGTSSTKNAKEEILQRAGYQSGTPTQEQFTFTAEPRTGKNLAEIESLLDMPEAPEVVQRPDSILSNNNSNLFGTAGASEGLMSEEETTHINNAFDDETELMTREVKPDPNLLEFVTGSGVSAFDSSESNLSNNTSTSNTTTVNISTSNTTTVNESMTTNTSNELSNQQSRTYIGNEYMSREQFNEINNIQAEFAPPQDDQALAVLELGTEFFQQQLGRHGLVDGVIEGEEPIVYTSADELIKPEKRNVLSKEGFEIFQQSDDAKTIIKPNVDVETGEYAKPYHEIKPIGNYGIVYDYRKRPSMQDLLESNQREEKALDEMTQKIEFLRDLRNERRHRINMMKLERANSYIVARSRRMAEARELKRLKKREEINLKAIEKADRMRRLQERQKLIELMKERQLKRSEEKRVATVLRLEREKRLERDAKYRSEIASIDSQIRHEQELIKRTELKMKAYFTKVHDDQLFDDSLRVAKKISKFVALERKADQMQELEERKRKDRIEKISRKFNKNIK